MLLKLRLLNPFATKTTPAPIAQPTIRTEVSKAIQECCTKIRASLSSLCCLKPLQKKVATQKPSMTKVVQAALKNVAQSARTHKKALIGIATVGAIGTAAYNWNAIDLLKLAIDRLLHSDITNQQPTILTYTQRFSMIGTGATIIGAAYCIQQVLHNLQPVYSNKQDLIAILDKWVNDPYALGCKEKAKKLIINAFENKNKVLNLSGLGLTLLPNSALTTYLRELLELDLSDNNLKSITLQDFPNLEHVKFSNNPDLTHLDLCHNNLSSITFQNLPNLEAVWLADNNLSSITLQNLPKLRHFTLNKNKRLKSITLQNLPELEACKDTGLQLPRHESLESITLQNLPKLRHFHLDYEQKLESITLQNLPYLEYLYLLNNTLLSRITLPTHLPMLRELHLNNNNLDSITLPTNLPMLRGLHLNNNNLDSITLPTHLPMLRELHLNNNNLDSITLQNLPELSELHLNNNNLDSITLQNLPNVRSLNLSHNNLSSIPLQNFTQLRELYVDYNRNLREIPLALAQSSNLLHLTYTGTLISRESVEQILDSRRSLRNRESLEKLPTMLRLWSSYCKNVISFSTEELALFSNTDKAEIYEWLTRLSCAQDFRSCQSALATTVCKILKGAIANPEFKELFISQIQANNECCQDRAAMALNELYLSYSMLCLPENGSQEDLIKLVIKGGKTQAFYTGLSKQINHHQKQSGRIQKESVEIFLYESIKCKEKFGLLTAIDNMAYSTIGKTDWINENALEKHVKQNFIDNAIEMPIFELLMNRDTAAKQELECIKNKEEYELGDKPEGDNESLAVLEWTTECNQKQEAREKAIKEFKRQWLLKSTSGM